MSLPKYAKYKDSGVHWLGSVPVHWTLCRLKNFARFSGGGTPSRDIPKFWGGDIPWVSPKDMKAESILQTEERITSAGLEGSSSTLVAPGRVLMVVRSGILKHTIPVAINEVPVALNQDLKAIQFEPDVCEGRFFLRFVQGSNDALLLAWAKQGATVESIEHDYLAETIVPLPPIEEQRAITVFLDRETAKIDALIGKQEKLIGLLAEKRQATISHVVTRGVNFDTPMKDSGVAWIGQVPEHWQVYPLKRALISLTSGSRGWAEHYADSGALFVRIGNLSRDGIDLDLSDVQRVAIPEGTEGVRTRVLPGDLLFSITAYLGSVAVAPQDIGIAFVSQHIALARLKTGNFLPEWLGYITLSVVGKTYLEMQGYGGTKIQLNLEDVGNLLTTVPSIAEQAQIVRMLSNELARLSALKTEAKRAIHLLKERRSALIAAAVTGQIDVRSAVPNPAVQEELAA